MSLRATSAPVRHPQKIGRYEILCQLGSGGMGVVYLGRLQSVGGFEKLVAIKVLHRHLASHAMVVEMLHTEARLAALIHHPNVVGMLDAGESEHGEHYVVMEYVDGVTLGDLLERLKHDAPRRMRLGVRLVLDAAAGLDAAHRLVAPSDGKPLRLVHRDVSTENVLVSLQGIGRMSDFGVAHVAMRRRGTLPGVKGTPCYMAPEQARGSEPIDARADVFSLGAVLWEVLTGKQLFESPSGVFGVLERVLQGEIEPPSANNPNVPAALDEVCLKALQRDPGLRYQTARELARDLERVARQHHIVASTSEVSRAVAQLFEPAIEQRRATIAQATGRESGEQLALPRSTPPPVPEHAKRTSGTFALPPVDDALRITLHGWTQPRWQRALALGLLPLIVTVAWCTLRPDPTHEPATEPATPARARALRRTPVRALALELALPEEAATAGDDATATVDAVTTQGAPLTAHGDERRRARDDARVAAAPRRLRVEPSVRSFTREARAARSVRALPRRMPAEADVDPLTDVLELVEPQHASAADPPLLEDNPYLMQR